MKNQNTINYEIDDIKILLEKIARMQREAVRDEVQEEMCDGEILGDIASSNYKYNTRPIQLFTDEDHAWHCPIGHDNDSCDGCEQSCIFRVERVEHCTAIFRALIPCEKGCRNEEVTNECQDNIPQHRHYKSTDSFITIKLDRIAAVRCLRDSFVDLCIV
jgi:Spore coat protein Z.